MNPSHPEKRRSIVVCGPTASGKSGLADEVSTYISDRGGTWTQTLVVDSMQVYKEIPNITNQARDRSAELTGIVSVTDGWSMGQHREAADKALKNTEGPFVLDAGTGMYLNGLLMDIDIHPKVPAQAREKALAESLSEPYGAVNQRRVNRERELEISGYTKAGSIWSPSLRYEGSIIYLRPGRAALDLAIGRRSKKIAQTGLVEAERLAELEERGLSLNPSVRSSIGVRELMGVISGTCCREEAETRISARTRKLARRQMRWFDKLVRTLSGSDDVRITVAENKYEVPTFESIIGLDNMSDIL